MFERFNRVRALLAAIALVGTWAGCSGGGAPPAPGAIRLTAVNVTSDGALAAAALADRDTTAPVAVDRATRVSLDFGRPVRATDVKVHGATNLTITAAGLSALAPEGEGGWSSAPLATGARTTVVELVLTPSGPGASLTEIEVWGPPRARAPRDPAGIAEASRRPAAQASSVLEQGISRLRIGRFAGTGGQAEPESPDDLLAVPAEPAAGTLKVDPVDPAERCLRAKVPGGVAVRSARRAYLVFDANVQRPFELQVSVGGGAPSEGLWLAATDRRATQVLEIDPERLGGGDDVTFCLPPEATGDVSIQELRLVLLLDAGRDGFDRDAERVLGAAADLNPATSAGLPPGRVELSLDRSTAVTESSLRLASPSARLHSVGSFDGRAWAEQGDVGLSSGENALPLAGRVASAVELTLEGARPDVPAASVAELSIAGSGVGPRVGASRLVVTSPRLELRGGKLAGERFGDRAYLAGWAESPRGGAIVEVDGAVVSVDGAFAVALRRPAGSTGSWSSTIRARFADGTEAVKVVHLDDDRAAEIAAGAAGGSAASVDARFGAENATSWGLLRASGGKVALGTDVSLDAPAGAVASDTRIEISRKGPEVMPKLDAGMVNVSAPAGSGYRFLPSGQKFAKPVRITLPYDPDLLPEGMLPEEIQTYYYDEDEKRWMTLARAEVRRATRQIVSETTHFTFMVNAVLVMPDHPGPVSFDPTSIKDLKAADPSSGIELVEPPGGNSQGSAKVSFPIRLPRARGAHQPSLSLVYDSSGADGWVGVGWDLPVSSVSIDTRYGVPLYDGEERYVLDGEPLVPVVLTEPCDGGGSGRRYMARVERDFRKVLRCGTDPTDYWFEVTDKSGTLHVYGKDENARLRSYVPRITAIPRHGGAYDVGQWFLERVVDPSGNGTRYLYQHDSRGLADRGDGRYREDFRQAYLSDIFYTARGNRSDGTVQESGAPYHVRLDHRNADRDDLVTSGRLGFKVVTRKLLGTIRVSLGEAQIRKYSLSYEKGDFEKQRLRTVEVFGADGGRFHAHGFEYTSKVAEARQADRVAAFAGPYGWDGPDDDAAMTASSDSGAGGQFFAGLGLGSKKGDGTVGVALGYNARSAKTTASFLDVNGDGLPDRMWREGGAWLATPPMTPVPAAPASLGRGFSTSGAMFALPPGAGLGKETSHVVNAAVQVMGFGAAGNFGGSWSVTESKELVLDANGDGVPDLLGDGRVFFGQPGCAQAGVPCFAESVPASAYKSERTPVPQIAADPTLLAAAAAASEVTSAQDVVLEWNAPFEGLVDVSGFLAFGGKQLQGGRHDGVRLAIYHWNPPLVEFDLFPPVLVDEQYKFPDDATATPVAQQVYVTAGDTLYFVLSTLQDFPVVEGPEEAARPYSPEEVGFAPVIAYLDVEAPLLLPEAPPLPSDPYAGYPFVEQKFRGQVDPTGAPAYVYDAGADLRVAGDPQVTVTVPASGTLLLSSHVVKKPSADDVQLCFDVLDPEGRRVKEPCPWLFASTDDWERDLDPVRLEVRAGSTIVFRVETRLSIDPATISWKIHGEMECVTGRDGACRPLPRNRPDLIAAFGFDALPNVHLHSSLVPRSTSPGERWLPADPRPFKPFVAPVAGKLRITFDGESPMAVFAIRTPHRLIARGEGELHFDEEVGVAAGEAVFLEAHGERDAPSPSSFSAHVKFRPENESRWYATDLQPTATTCRRGDRFDLGNVPLLSGGYHGWRYGLWHGGPDEPFDPSVFRSPPAQAQSRYRWQKIDDDDDDEEWKRRVKPLMKAAMKRPPPDRQDERENGERRRARLMAPLVPRPGEAQERLAGLAPAGRDAWASTDGNAYVYAGGMSAARRGGTRGLPPGGSTAGVAFGVGDVGRLTVGQNYMAGLSVGPLSMQVGTGMSQQKQDVIDLNGDRIPDVVVSGDLEDVSSLTGDGLARFLGGDAASEARITNPADFGYRESVSIPIHARLNTDVSGQAGLGVSEAIKMLRSKLHVAAVAGRWPDMSVSGDVGVGVNQSTTAEDLVDVNGDGLPDAVRKADGCAGFAVRLNLGTSFALGEDCIATGGWNASGLTGVAAALDASAEANPDDDPDTERLKGLAGGMASRGRDPKAIRQVSTVTVQGGVSAAIDYEHLGVSVNTESSLSATNIALVDVTGDGLPDYLARKNDGSDFLVMVNTGYGFTEAVRWSAPAWPAGARKPELQGVDAAALRGAGDVGRAFLSGVGDDGIDPLEASGTHGVSPTMGFVFTVSMQLFYPVPWLHLSFGLNGHHGRDSGFELGLTDIDGDGLADHVLKTSEGKRVVARVNRLGGGNLLKRVIRPLGGSFELEYARAGNTVEMPQNQYVLSKVTVHDGVGTGTGHDLATRYEYAGGYHERNEREFLGFAAVTRRNGDGSKVVQTFLNRDYRQKGLLATETVLDAKERPLVATVNQYFEPRPVGAVDPACALRTPATLVYGDGGYCASSFVPLQWTERRFHEGAAVAEVVSRQEFDYDAYGNVTRFDDLGDVADPSDDLRATVTYGPGAAAGIYCVGAPVEITATDGSGNLLRQRKGEYDGQCRMQKLHSLVNAGGAWATAGFEYWTSGISEGSLKTVTSPPNHRGEAYTVTYTYDDVIGAYVTHTVDAHGYESSAKHDYRFGEGTYTRDVNGQETWRTFDEFGRLAAVAAPGFTLSAPTIGIAYEIFEPEGPWGPRRGVPYALTKNALPRGGTLDTVVVMDGLGRVIQTKKTAEIRAGKEEATAVGWAVTGQQRFDVMGRVSEQGQTFFQSGASPTLRVEPPRNPTHLFYDALGRMVQTVEPNGAMTRVVFGIGVPEGTGYKRLRTVATDAMEKVRAVYKDPADRTVAVEEHIEGRRPTTTYAYDPVGELVLVRDAAGNRTAVSYDLLGRRTTLDNPDAGLVEFHFDLAGNLTEKIDANLRKAGQKISYVYDYERLKEIRYPAAARNVVYEYGPPGAGENGAARITKVVDEVGSETRAYDALGNLARTTRSINPLRPSDRIRTYETRFRFDVFGRMLSMVYPDGETLEYRYDRGGLLKTAQGERPATKHEEAQTETYLARLLYDEFGQRVRLRVGNGVVSEYGYEPLTRRLASLHTQKPGSRLLQKLSYRYDLVGNVLGVTNALGEAQPSHAGEVAYSYGYDDLHRLTYAHGEAKSRPSTRDTFTSHFTYSDIHNMKTNVQEHHVLHGPTGGGEYPPQTNHAFEYTYEGAGPHQATRIGDTSLVYDGNGNTLRECRDPADATCTAKPSHLRRFLWTEENRLDAVIDAGGRHVTKFFYDAAGERIAKLGRGGESITVGQFWALKGRRAAMKHVFAGTTRVASKLLPPPGWDDVPRGPPPGEVATTTTSTTSADNDTGCDPSSYQPQKCTILPGGDPVLNDYYLTAKVRPDTYYYHPDHLGSTSWVTDQNARVHERVEYFPYGEVWRDTRSDVGASPVRGQRFLFTGKELDEETGLYYFGARYYQPRMARWLSPDPMLTTGFGHGMTRTENFALYAYGNANPTRFIDPDGRCSVRSDYTLDCTSRPNAAQGGLERAIVQDVRDGDYGSAAAGTLLWFGNLANIAAGYAAQFIVGEPYNAGYNGMGGLIEGDYDRSLEGWVGVLALAVSGKMQGPTPRDPGCPACPCFVPGTLVLMEDGSTKPIEAIRPGDRVMAVDPEGADAPAGHEVIAVDENWSEAVVRIAVEDAGVESEIEATSEHPFWTLGAGWVAAREIAPGDQFLNASGRSVEVRAVTKEARTTATHNLSVDGAHTFFVVAGTRTILVHNELPKIHAPAPDWATKGAHVTSNGIELSVTGGGSGNIKITPTFQRDANNPGLKNAIRNVQKAIADPKWRERLLATTQRATQMLGGGSAVERAGSGGTRALEVALKRMPCP